MAVTLSGVGSNVDFSPLIDALVAAERIPIAALEQRKTDANRQISTIGDLVTKLKALSTKAAAFDTPSEVRSMFATSSDESKLLVAASGAALPAHLDIEVLGLAAAETSRSKTFDSDSNNIAGTGTLGIQVGSDAAVYIDYDASDSLSGIAQKINDSEARASAFVLFDGTDYRLMVTSAESGENGAITFSDPGDQLGFNLADNELVEAADASISINGQVITRSSNRITDAIAGMTFTLVAETGGEPVTVGISDDPPALRKRVEELISTFNDVARAVNGQLSNDQSKNATRDSLFGDSSLRSLQRSLGGLVTRAYAHDATTTSLASYGIGIGNDGTLTIDATKFDAAVTQNGEGLEDLLAGAGGFIQSLTEAVDRYTDSTTGVLVGKRKGLEKRVRDFDSQIDRIDDRASQVETRLRRQFAALDKTMTSINVQTGYLAALYA